MGAERTMAHSLCICVFLLTVLGSCVWALDNGLALTPPMGWMGWERFRCTIDCKDDPYNCISENLFKVMADHIAADGFKDAGYEIVSVDEGWSTKQRGPDGRLQHDPVRFPSGMRALADYIHSKGLKFGMYLDVGTKTCAGYPGSEYYLQLDAQTLADWQVDYLKFDGCNCDSKQFDDAYPAMGMWLNRTGRPIVYSCSWPAYMELFGVKPNYPRIAKYCNLWRNFEDIQDSWASVADITNFFGDDKTDFIKEAGPGHFNDPDMLIVGDFGLSYEQQRAQMALWAVMAAPFMMSVDLRKIKPESKALLLNKNVIAIDQDALGIQGRRIRKANNEEVWTRPILPKGSMAFVFLSTDTAGMPRRISSTLVAMGMNHTSGYNVTDVFTGSYIGKFRPQDTFMQPVNPTGVFFGKAVPLP